jgi:alginate O-acetyltransferase complex protein AlgJ
VPVRERPIAPETSDVDRRVGVPLMAFFLVVVGTPIVVQPVYEAVKKSRIQELDIFRKPPTLENISSFEDAIAEEAVVAKLARPYTQWTTLTLMRQGNEKVMVGREGWLFHRPGVYYVTGFSFRSHYVKNDRAVPEDEWDPLPAILQYHAQLERRGVELVLVPLPVKAQIYPEKLRSVYDVSRGPPANVYADGFFDHLGRPKTVEDLDALYDGFGSAKDRGALKRFFGYLGDPGKMTDEEAFAHAKAFRTGGLTVIDLSRDLWEAKPKEARRCDSLYLPLDTHWTPKGMKVAARALAARLRELFPWLSERKVEYSTRERKATRHGDLYYMLDLPGWSEAFPECTVTTEQVIDPSTGGPVSRDNPDSEVVLLGDSFSNVYSTEEKDERGMKWGTGAGFGEHLMKELGRPIQVIAVNGGAPTATRKLLNKKTGVTGKKLVIWSFATRELITPDTEWELVRVVDEVKRAAAAGPLVVTAEIVKTSTPPRPGVDPYPEALTCTLYRVLEVEEGSYEDEELVAIEWVMKEFKLLPAAEYGVGEIMRLTLVPWDDKVDEDPNLDTLKQLDETGVFTPPYWVVEAERLDHTVRESPFDGSP